jgi:hypothetical protein
MGEANASIPTVQPVYGRPMWAAEPSSAGIHSVIWASKASIDNGKYTCGVLSGIVLMNSLLLRYDRVLWAEEATSSCHMLQNHLQEGHET